MFTARGVAQALIQKPDADSDIPGAAYRGDHRGRYRAGMKMMISVLAAGLCLTACGASGTSAACTAVGLAAVHAGVAAQDAQASQAPGVVADQMTKTVHDLAGRTGLAGKAHDAAAAVVADLRAGRSVGDDLAAFNDAMSKAQSSCPA